VTQILTYNEIDCEEWETLVKGSTTGTWFQTPEAYDFFASMPDLFKPFVVAISNEAPLSEAQHSINPSLQTLRAVCVGYVTKEKNPVKQFFTRRAIIIGGPALADDASLEEVEALMIAVRDQLTNIKYQILNIKCAPIYIETRNFNDYSKWKNAFVKAGFVYQPHLNFHVDCSNKEVMWNRMSDNRKRQIKKMSASNACLMSREHGSSNDDVTEKDVQDWYAILVELYRTKVKTPLWPVEFFLEAYRQRVGQFLLVRHEGKVIGGSMVVEWKKSSIINHQSSINAKGVVYEWFECGLNAQYKDQYPSVCATYAGMCYAAENRIAKYDMMGAGVPGVPYGVRDFKAEFGGQMVEHGRFVCVCEPLLYKIGVFGVKMMKR